MSITSALLKTVTRLVGVGAGITKSLLGENVTWENEDRDKVKNKVGKLAATSADQHSLESANEVLGLIYRQMVRAREDQVYQKEVEDTYLKEDKKKQIEREEALIKALSLRRKPKVKKAPPKKEKPKEEPAKPKEEVQPAKPKTEPVKPKAEPVKPKVEPVKPKAEPVRPAEAPKTTPTAKPVPKPAPAKPTAVGEKIATGVAIGTAAAGAAVVAAALAEAGLSSKAQANILAQVESESNFKPRNENLNYSTPEAIQKTFGKTRIPTLEFASQFVNNPEALANHVYAKTDGNSAQGDGWKYRGRGFLQHTGKNQYESIKKYTGIDVVSNPDLLNDPTVAAKAVPWFFLSYKGKKPEQLENITTVNKAVGFADVDGKKAEKRAELAKKYESGSFKGNTPLPTSLTPAPTNGNRIDNSSKENDELKKSLKDKQSNVVNNTTVVSSSGGDTGINKKEQVNDRPILLTKGGK